MTAKPKSGRTRQRYSQQDKTEHHWPLPKKSASRQRPDNWGFMRANFIAGEARSGLRRIEAPWKNGFLWTPPRTPTGGAADRNKMDSKK